MTIYVIIYLDNQCSGVDSIKRYEQQKTKKFLYEQQKTKNDKTQEKETSETMIEETMHPKQVNKEVTDGTQEENNTNGNYEKEQTAKNDTIEPVHAKTAKKQMTTEKRITRTKAHSKIPREKPSNNQQ